MRERTYQLLLIPVNTHTQRQRETLCLHKGAVACQFLELPSLGFEGLIEAEPQPTQASQVSSCGHGSDIFFPARVGKKKSGNTLTNIGSVAGLESETE